MKLTLVRKYKKLSYTIGDLLINGKFFCSTLEDADRGLDDSMSIDKILSLKIAGVTAIPYGTYKITLDVVSPKYRNVLFYKETCEGKVPRLLNVKGFDGILIHTGNTHLDSYGCVLVGENKVKGKVINSKETFKKLYRILKLANQKGELITISIVK